MSARFNPFPKVSGKYGAPMGRSGGQLDTSFDVSEYATSGPQGEYDCGGAYWGLGGKEGPVYAVWRRGHGREGVAYVRAKSKAAAIRAALDM